jgi:hypothetical protein
MIILFSKSQEQGINSEERLKFLMLILTGNSFLIYLFLSPEKRSFQ